MTLDKKEFSDERKTSDVISKLQTLRKDKYRIIIGDFYQDMASQVLCGAYYLQMTGREVRGRVQGDIYRTWYLLKQFKTEKILVFHSL